MEKNVKELLLLLKQAQSLDSWKAEINGDSLKPHSDKMRAGGSRGN